MNSFVPILIINWNGIDDTIECIDSVFKLKDVPYKIILADNGSESVQVKELKARFGDDKRIDLILYDSNHGFAKGTNLMLKYVFDNYKTQIDYIALLNNDTVVDEHWLSNLVNSAKVNNGDIVASKMVDYFNHDELDNLGHRMMNTGEIIPIAHREKPSAYNDTITNFGSCAGASLYRADMLGEIGFFDPYFTTGYEDAELGARALVAGYKTITCPDAIVYHKISQSVSKVFDFEYVLKIQKSIFYSYFKLMPAPVLLINLPFILFKYLMVFLVDIFTWRPKYLKMLLRTFRDIFTTERGLFLDSRKAFQNKHKTVSSISILRKQEFFLWWDIKRFWNFVVLRKKSEFDKIKEKGNNAKKG